LPDLESPLLVCGLGHAIPIGHELRGCPDCRADGAATALEVQYDPRTVTAAWAATSATPERHGLAEYEAAGALPDGAAAISLGEGRTPLHPSPLGEGGGAARIWLKLEGFGPTGSYKDRLNAVAVSMARRFGARGIVCSSTGNQGASMAAYAAAAGMPAVVLLPVEAPEAAARQAAIHGATVVVTPWDVRPKVIDALLQEEGWSLSNRNDPRPWANPFGLEGYRSIAFEIVQQLGHAPAMVVMPTCGGDGIYGIWKGFRELAAAGIIAAAPRMVAVQPSLSDSLVRAVADHDDHVKEVPLRTSIALSLTDRKTSDLALRAVRESGGTALAVTEDQIRDAVGRLARTGIYAEPASAAAIAALPALDDAAGGDVVCIVTANGTRWPVPGLADGYARLDTFEAVMDHVRGLAAGSPA
jgi:threonine synthase